MCAGARPTCETCETCASRAGSEQVGHRNPLPDFWGASAMGVSLQEVERIEHHVRKEEALKAERIGLCFPDGNPFAG